MAVFAFTNGYVSLNGVDLSDHCKGVELTVSIDELDTTAFGSTGYKSSVAGLKSGSLKVTFNQDFAASKVDATMWPLLGTSIAFEVRADAGAVSATNPKFTGNVLVTQYQPLSGTVATVATVDITMPTTGAVTRATS